MPLPLHSALIRGALVAATMTVPLVLSACGVGGSVGCDFREEMVNGIRCQQRDGIQAVSFGPACEAAGGIPLEGGCPEEGKVQGCVFDSSEDVTDWYYEPMTLEQIAIECESDGTLVDP